MAGLDVTFDGEPFEPLPTLMALAERVDKLTAICSVCGEEAVFHVRVDGPAPRPATWSRARRWHGEGPDAAGTPPELPEPPARSRAQFAS